MAGCFFKWKLNSINIYPYGGCTKFDVDINKPLKEEFFVLIMGPLFQIIFFYIFKNYISINYINLFNEYNLIILIFNLLPIYPLDGGKLINIVISKFISFKYSLIFSYISSYLIFVLIFLILYFYSFLNILNFTILIFLFINVIKENRKINYCYEKFLIERLLNNYDFKREVYIDKCVKMKKDCYHFIFWKNQYESEKKYLKYKYYV